MKNKIPTAAIFVALAVMAQAQGGPPGPGGPPRKEQGYSIEQATSENAQLHTIAFSGLAFITGDFGASTFMPPGKVCDFFGFQYMRDIDSAQKGHNPAFLSRVAGNVLKTLTPEQKQLFVDLANEQVPKLDQLARMRFPVIKAFTRQLNGEVPSGSVGLNKAEVSRYLGDLYALDGELSYRRAEVMAKVAKSLTADQKAFFSSMKFGDFGTWPAVDEREQMREVGRGKSQLFNVAFMTYASEFYSWYAGSLTADTYFCPERHGTYFGGFYMKDMPAMGKRDYDISLSMTGDSGKAFLDALTPDQRKFVTGITVLQSDALKEIVRTRAGISRELRGFLTSTIVDHDKVIALCRRYGELDGELSYYEASAFAKVNKTLTAEQRAALRKLRNLEGYTSAPYYLFAQAMREAPELGNTDSFFFPPKTKSQ